MKTPLNTTLFFFFNDTATTEIYTLSLHDALPISADPGASARGERASRGVPFTPGHRPGVSRCADDYESQHDSGDPGGASGRWVLPQQQRRPNREQHGRGSAGHRVDL